MGTRILCVVFVLSVAAPALAGPVGMVQMYITVDDPVLNPGDDTILRIFAEVPGGAANNGIYAYALNVLTAEPGILSLDSVLQLGSPAAFYSSPGSILADGLHDVYGGDGGFFTDQNRGIGSPFELLNIPITALAPGLANYSVSLADIANDVGIPDGFLLQQPGSVIVDFGQSVSITIVPEPGTITLLAMVALWIGRRSLRRS
jgi:hypothetical protein